MPSSSPPPTHTSTNAKDPWRHAVTIVHVFSAIVVFGGASILLAAIVFGLAKGVMYLVSNA